MYANGHPEVRCGGFLVCRGHHRRGRQLSRREVPGIEIGTSEAEGI